MSKFLENRKFKENTFWFDVKIVVIALACLLGYLSHFVFRFPKNAPEVA